MSNVIATVTIESQDESLFFKLLGNLDIEYNCRSCENIVLRGHYAVKLTIDMPSDALEYLQDNMKMLHVTVIPYIQSPIGLKIATVL